MEQDDNVDSEASAFLTTLDRDANVISETCLNLTNVQ